MSFGQSRYRAGVTSAVAVAIAASLVTPGSVAREVATGAGAAAAARGTVVAQAQDSKSDKSKKKKSKTRRPTPCGPGASLPDCPSAGNR